MDDLTNENVATEPCQIGLEIRNPTDEQILRFQRRASFYAFSAFSIVLIILLLIGAAAYVFFFAQTIERTESGANIYRQIQTALNLQKDVIKSRELAHRGAQEEAKVGSRVINYVLNLSESLYQARAKKAVLEAKEKLFLEHGYITDAEKIVAKEEISAKISILEEHIKYVDEELKRTTSRQEGGELTQTDVADNSAYLTEKNAELQILKSNLDTSDPAAEIRKKTGNIDVLSLISTNLIRFGGIGVTLFMIGILIPMYRYNTRLSTFYLARADALLLCKDGREVDFEMLCTLLTPTHAFEKEPATPIAALSKLAQGGLTLANKAR